MNGSKGCAIYGLGGITAFILGLVLLFTMVGGNASAPANTGDPTLDTSKVPAYLVPLIEEAASTCSILSAPLLAAQFYQESGFNPNAVSDTGAMGITQFEPGTWKTWESPKDGDGKENPYNPADEIPAAGRYDCALAAEVITVPGDPIGNMLAAYNAGPGAVLQYQGIPPYAQTQDYVKNIEKLVPSFELSLAATGAPPAGTSFAAAEIAAAEKYLGLPYVWAGGNYTGPTNAGVAGGPVGFDCSGLVMYAVYQASGGKISLPHSSEQDATLGTAVSPSDIQPGDVIAIQVEKNDYSHVVIYIGGGQIIEAPTTGEDVKLAPLSDFAGDVEAIRRFS